MTDASFGPFHQGEIEAQRRAGEGALAARTGGMIKDVIAAGARAFLGERTLVVVAGSADDGSVWASPLLGEPGLVRSSDGHELVIDLARAARVPSDPLWSALRAGADLGLLAIDLAARRRLRINVRVTSVEPARIRASVREAYANCPKYIHRRHVRAEGGGPDDEPSQAGAALDDDRLGIIERADTFFVASRHADRGADASHRGGPVGFVTVVRPDLLWIPDYAGNGMYQTLGNLLLEPRAGLAFLDFAGGRLLQLVGSARVLFDDPRGRGWELEVHRWLDSPLPSAWRSWELLEPGVARVETVSERTRGAQ